MSCPRRAGTKSEHCPVEAEDTGKNTFDAEEPENAMIGADTAQPEQRECVMVLQKSPRLMQGEVAAGAVFRATACGRPLPPTSAPSAKTAVAATAAAFPAAVARPVGPSFELRLQFVRGRSYRFPGLQVREQLPL